ncbi:MAG: hypothetical protein H7329_10035 [Opitutaceae bacterium]|nr:hypothetical protein [Cytophagales bacterium]
MRILFILILFFTNALFAQSPDILLKWAKPEPYPSITAPSKIIYSNDQNMLVYKPANTLQSCRAEWLSKSNMLTTKQITASQMGVTAGDIIIDGLADENHFQQIFAKQDKKMITVYGSVYSFKDGKLLVQPKQLDQIKKKKKEIFEMVYVKQSASNQFTGLLSKIEEQAYVFAYRYKAFDIKLNEIASIEFPKPLADYLFEFKKFVVDEAGNGYLYVKEKKNPNVDANIPRIFFFSIADKSFNEITLPANLPFMDDFIFQTDKDGNMEIIGNYSKTEKKTDFFGGIFYLNVKKGTNQITETLTYPFVNSQMTTLPKKEFNPEKGLMYEYRLIGCMPASDGGKTFVMENKFTNINAGYYINNFNILVMRANKTGQFLWASNVYKKQYQILSPTLGYYYFLWKKNPPFNIYEEQICSFACLYKGNDVFLLYVDNATNLGNNLKELKDMEPYNTNENACFVAKVNKDGAVSKNILYPLKSEIFRPAFTGQVSIGKELLISSFDIDSKEPAYKLGLFQPR